MIAHELKPLRMFVCIRASRSSNIWGENLEAFFWKPASAIASMEPIAEAIHFYETHPGWTVSCLCCKHLAMPDEPICFHHLRAERRWYERLRPSGKRLWKEHTGKPQYWVHLRDIVTKDYNKHLEDRVNANKTFSIVLIQLLWAMS